MIKNTKRLSEILRIPLSLSSKKIHIRRVLIKNILDYSMKFFDFKSTPQTKILNSNLWNHLIILDACRYDFFEEMVHKYLDGALYPVLSPGSNTIQWLKRTWIGRYPNVVYFSSIPFINNKVPIHGFYAREKFGRIIELWNLAQTNKLLVHPRSVNEIVKLFRSTYRLKSKLYQQKEKHRFIIHYAQPHFPYINMPENINKFIIKLLESHHNISGETAFLMLSKYIFSDEQQMREWIKKMYLDNLAIVLRYVAELIPYLDGRIIITADHGELLGEYGMYYHLTNAPLLYLRTVPLFIVK